MFILEVTKDCLKDHRVLDHVLILMQVWLIRAAADLEHSASLQPDHCSKASSNWTSREERSCSCDCRQILWGLATAPRAVWGRVFECKQPASQIQLRSPVKILFSFPFTLLIDVHVISKTATQASQEGFVFFLWELLFETAVFKGTVHPKMEICCKCTLPHAIQDVEELVSS